MYVTLNISNRSLKLLTVKGRQVKKWESAPLEAGLVHDGLMLQPEAVGKAIDTLFRSTGAPRDRVITSLTGLSFIYRFLSLPHLKPALREEALRRAAGREISLPLEELYLSWQAIGTGGEEQDFIILGVPRNIVDALKQTLSTAHLEPYLMDLNPLALARAAGRREAIIANLEPDCFDIVLVADGVPAIMHTITPRGEGATLEDNIRRLTDELSRTLGFYQSNHPENSLSSETPLLLSGELATEAAASGLLQAEIEYPVAPLSPPLDLPSELPAAAYAVNLGLALKKLKPKTAANGEDAGYRDININTFSGKFPKARAKPLPAGQLLLTVLLILAAGLLFPLFQARNQLHAENAILQDELYAATRELNLAGLIAEETSLKEQAIREITANATILEEGYSNLLAARGESAGKLLLVTQALPARTPFREIAIGPETITVRGETDDPFAVVSYAENMEVQEVFSDVRITIIDETTFTEETGDEAAPAETTVLTFEVTMKK